MIDERQQELASLYALDLLEGAERTEFEALLGQHAELRRLVEELRDAAASLAHTAPMAEPSASLKTRVLASLPPQAADNVVAFTPRKTPWIPWALAAGFALAAVWLGERNWVTQTENRLLAQRQQLADLALKSAQTQIEAERILAARFTAEYDTLKADTEKQLADVRKREADARAELVAANERNAREADLARLKITTLASMLNNSPQALAVAVWDADRQAGVFTVDQLPANGADHQYELWVIDSKPVSAGVFTVGPDGRAKVQFKPVTPVRAVAKFAVSREKNDGARSHAAPGEVIMISQ